MSADPIFSAIEAHRLADAAYDDSLERRSDDALTESRSTREKETLVALLRTRPETVAGGLAVLRYIADWAENNDAGLFHDWHGPMRSAGAAFIPMIADAIEAANDRPK